MIYAIDSDILSYMIKGDREAQESFDNIVGYEDSYCIPPLVYYEVKRGLTYKGATAKLKIFENFYDYSIKNDVMNMEIWKKAITIYVLLKSKGRLIGDGDIFIAAFCIVNDYVLITNNTKHFEIIEELKMTNSKN